MNWIEGILRISIIIVFYTFLGYGILLYLIVFIKRIFKRPVVKRSELYEPEITLVIPCFNEADIIGTKITNCRELDYPVHKLSIIFITDGSTDHFAEILSNSPDIQLLHQNIRAGKTEAENRAMHFVHTPIVIFSDANTILNREALRNMVKHFTDAKTGCVSGEKRIVTDLSNSASASGEGIYWKYESILKRLDFELNSAVGAAGELVAFRTSLYEALPEDTLLDDFMQSMQIAAKGYTIVYEPEAFALETASLNVKEELKRKIRISAGNWQAMKRLSGILRFTQTPILFFQYVSHKILRWAVAPFLLIIIFFLSIILTISGDITYQYFLLLQLLFYAIAIAGHVFENRNTRYPFFFVPYYFCVMNYAALAGFRKFLSGTQKTNWEKAKRKTD